MNVPESLPSLSAGAHDADAGEACVMEYVSVLAGEPWSDRPECTHPLLAHEARTANDLLTDADRSRLVPLVGRLFGAADDSPTLRARLRLAQARQVLRLVEPSLRAAVTPYVEHAEALVDLPVPLEESAEVTRAVDTARSLPSWGGDLDPEHAQHHVGASRVMAFALSPDLGAAEAWALTALAAAHRLAAAECRADCADDAARARRMVRDLGELLDVYDEVTERVTSDVSTADATRLAAHL